MADPGPPRAFTSPRASAEALSALIGAPAVAAWCAELLTGQIDDGAADRPSLVWLAGEPARIRLAQKGSEGSWKDYWVRTWALRGLLYAWHPAAAPAVVTALDDEAWRVREMAAKVARLRELGEAADALARLTTDETERVRVAAARALGRTAESEHLAALVALLDDPAPKVGGAAEQALAEAAGRLDVPVDLDLQNRLGR